jgi:predicted transcriptional regulator
MDQQPESRDKLVEMTSNIVSSYVANNQLGVDAVPGLVESVFKILDRLVSQKTNGANGSAEERPQPAVPIKRSVHRHAITCLECGGSFKSLRRHLSVRHGMSIQDYRSRWDLPGNYPFVAPEYAAVRSQFAKKIGLGRASNKGRKAAKQKRPS